MARAWLIPQLQYDDPVRLALARIVCARTREVFSRLAEVLRSADTDAVHDMRVSARRLQAVFAVFGEWMPGDTARRFRKRLRPIIRALGAMREHDVTARMIQRMREDAAVEQSTAVGLCIARSRHAANLSRGAVTRALEEACADGVQERLVEFSRRLERSVASAHRKKMPTFAAVMPEALQPILQRVTEHASAVGDIARSTEQLHRLRIAAKPLRYALELLVPLRDPSFRTVYEQVRETVQLLGDLHDLDVTIDAMRAHIAELRLYNRDAIMPERISVAPLEALVSRARQRRDALERDLTPALERWRAASFVQDVLDVLD